jgi:hypothetical protein
MQMDEVGTRIQDDPLIARDRHDRQISATRLPARPRLAEGADRGPVATGAGAHTWAGGGEHARPVSEVRVDMGARHQRGWRRLAWSGTVAGLVLAGGLVQATAAHAAVGQSPARTWGVGPDTTTPAAGGKPRVLAILPIGDRIFVGGTFDTVIDPAGITYPAKNIAVFSATTGAADLSFKASAGDTVTTLATDGSQVFIGGAFNTVNGVNRRGLAAVDSRTGLLTSWNATVNAGQVDALAYWGGSLYAGGNFGSISGSGGTSRAFAAKLSSSSAAVDTGWSAAPNERVRALNVAVGGGRLYLGGEFSQVSGRGGTNKLAAVSLSSGAVDTAFVAPPTNDGAYSPVYDLTSDAFRVYAASAGGGGACAAASATTGALVWTAKSNGNMQSVRLKDGLLYCAGHYGGAGSFMGQDRQKLAAVDAATGVLDSFAPRINSSQGPWALAVDADHLYMGGDFNKVSGVRQPHFAMFVDSSARTKPAAPASLLSEAGTGLVDLRWSPSSTDGGSKVTKHRVYRSTTAGGQNLGQPLASVSGSTWTYRDTNVVNGTRYYYVVIAENALGKSAPSEEASATPSASTVVTPPSAPRGLAVDNTSGPLRLSWNAPLTTGGAPVTSYRIYRSAAPASQPSTPLTTVGGTTTTWDDLGGMPGVTYYYIVRAVNSAGPGPASNEASAMALQTPPDAPVLSGTVVAGPGARLTWTIPANNGAPIEKYVILRDAVRLVVLPADASQGPTTFTDTTASNGTHVYQIRAANSGGNGDLSNKVSLRIR